MTTRIGPLLAALLLSAQAAAAQDPKKLNNSFDFSFADTAGNSNTQSYSLSDRVSVRFLSVYALSARAAGYFSRFRQTTTSEWFNSDMRLDRRLGEKAYAYGLGGWERNRFSGIARRLNGSAGGGYNLLTGKSHALQFEAGFSLQDELRVTSQEAQAKMARVAGNYRLNLSATAKLKQEAEGLFDSMDSGDNRYRSVTSLEVAVTKYTGLRVAYTYNYRGRPIAGFRKWDRLFSTGFYVTY